MIRKDKCLIAAQALQEIVEEHDARYGAEWYWSLAKRVVGVTAYNAMSDSDWEEINDIMQGVIEAAAQDNY